MTPPLSRCYRCLLLWRLLPRVLLKSKALCRANSHRLLGNASRPPCAITSFWGAAIAAGVGEGQELLSWKQKRRYVHGLIRILSFDFYTTQEVSYHEAGTIPKFAMKHLKTGVISVFRQTEEGVQSLWAVFSHRLLERCPLRMKGLVWGPKREENEASQSFRNLKGWGYP